VDEGDFQKCISLNLKEIVDSGWEGHKKTGDKK
jgi:hypothetical protein